MICTTSFKINFHFIQGVIMLIYTAIAVTLLVPQTVKTTRVTYKMEPVPRVNMDGLDYIVIQV